MKKLYIVDYIGISSGMRYYHEALVEQLQKAAIGNIEVLSNYSSDNKSKPFFPEIFKRGLLFRVINLIKSFYVLKRKARKEVDSVFIFLCYGSIIDVVLLPALQANCHHILDIHDPIMKGKESSGLIVGQLSKCYKRAKTIIYHSESALETVRMLGFNGNSIFVPHFPYTITKEYKSENLSDDIKNSIEPSKCNILFFGNINFSKGPDIFINAINSMPEKANDDYHFIMAGKVSDNSLEGLSMDSPLLHTVLRMINDDELKYLYSRVDYLLLPYRETYQSGVLEMAFRFKVPAIVSDVPYFKSVLEEYPSFGVLTKIDVESITKTILSLNSEKESYFNDIDMEKYNNRKDFVEFRENIKTALLTT